MTNLKYIQTCSKEQLTKFLCELFEGAPDVCSYCPASKHCFIGHTGFQDWLDDEREEVTGHDGESGKWIPLGHRMGVLKHPFSEDYRCSLCGYEQYTIFEYPPRECPKCRATMTLGEE